MLLRGSSQQQHNINHYQNAWLFQLKRQCRVISNLSRNLTFPKLLRVVFLLGIPLLHLCEGWTASRRLIVRPYLFRERSLDHCCCCCEGAINGGIISETVGKLVLWGDGRRCDETFFYQLTYSLSRPVTDDSLNSFAGRRRVPYYCVFMTMMMVIDIVWSSWFQWSGMRSDQSSSGSLVRWRCTAVAKTII